MDSAGPRTKKSIKQSDTRCRRTMEKLSSKLSQRDGTVGKNHNRGDEGAIISKKRSPSHGLMVVYSPSIYALSTWLQTTGADGTPHRVRTTTPTKPCRWFDPIEFVCIGDAQRVLVSILSIRSICPAKPGSSDIRPSVARRACITVV